MGNLWIAFSPVAAKTLQSLDDITIPDEWSANGLAALRRWFQKRIFKGFSMLSGRAAGWHCIC